MNRKHLCLIISPYSTEYYVVLYAVIRYHAMGIAISELEIGI